MNFIKIKETCLYVHDLELARRFYHEILKLPVINYEVGKHIFFRLGSSVLLCFNPEDSKTKSLPPPHFAEGKQHLAFEVSVADYESTKEELRAKGIQLTDEVTWKSGARSFYFEDFEGNVLEILPDEGMWD